MLTLLAFIDMLEWFGTQLLLFIGVIACGVVYSNISSRKETKEKNQKRAFELTKDNPENGKIQTNVIMLDTELSEFLDLHPLYTHIFFYKNLEMIVPYYEPTKADEL